MKHIFSMLKLMKKKVVTYKYKVCCTKCDTVYNRKVLKGGPQKYVQTYVCGNCRGKLKVEKC